MDKKGKIHTTNYFDAFIEVAEDCPASRGEAPKSKGDKKSVAEMQYELLVKNPYKFTSDDILFQIFAVRNDLTPSEYETARKDYFSKGQACLRASPLTKRYGFGIHADENGKVALYAVESDEYREFLNNPKIKKVKAMRTSRK